MSPKQEKAVKKIKNSIMKKRALHHKILDCAVSLCSQNVLDSFTSLPKIVRVIKNKMSVLNATKTRSAMRVLILKKYRVGASKPRDVRMSAKDIVQEFRESTICEEELSNTPANKIRKKTERSSNEIPLFLGSLL